ncbi:pilus assembly protein TadG-related protein [Salinibacterium sp. SYSU T00001]|uniref:pilus assembly protein TadG-related protein n=1 Tax=Homoserinimonas sedimenticola TaxID=2986805 RepID=UPI002236443F|nr:pilus assembly protein TadG-related protein [Salinibacterium sedimenticola]MCW4386593.1 pilus assembly protein TadG-related protein [Salinibacterium sedimenticola]
MRRLLRDESGSTLILTIFYAALSLVLILLVTAATSLYLERKRLFTLADGAALAGAEAFDLTDVTTVASGPGVVLDDSRVSAAVAAHVAAVPHDFEGLVIERAESPGGSGAVVGLSALWRPPVVSLLVPEGIRIGVEASARSVFG